MHADFDEKDFTQDQCAVQLFKSTFLHTYSSQHINESKVLHKYVMNEFLVACCSRQTKYFWEQLFQNL